jgi:Gpi18-like mannosyltransferase
VYVTLTIGFTLIFAVFSIIFLKDFDYVISAQRLLALSAMSALPILPVGLYFGLKRRVEFTTLLFILTASCVMLAIRMACLDFVSPDYRDFLQSWTGQMRAASGVQALTQDIGDYNMPYLYVLTIIAKMPLHTLYPIKFFSIYFDFILAYYVMQISSLFFKSFTKQLAVFFAVLMLPTVIVNSAFWAQCDVVYAALAVASVYYGLTKRSALCMIMMALAFSFKLQTIFVLPFLIVLLMAGRINWKHLLYFPATFIATLLPAIAVGKPVLDTVSIYFEQTGQYPRLTLNAPSLYASIYQHFLGFSFKLFDKTAVCIAGTAVFIVLYYCWLKRKSLDTSALLLIAFLFALMVPFLLPRMHERYFYMADILSIGAFFVCRKRIFVPFVMVYVSFRACSAFIFADRGVNFHWLVIMLVVLLTVTISDILKIVSKNEKEAVQVEKQHESQSAGTAVKL